METTNPNLMLEAGQTSMEKLSTSPMGLGCMGMSEFYGTSNDKQSIRTLLAAADLGITLFDTADVYGSGHNESLLASAFGNRADITIATKFGVLRDDKGNFTGLNGTRDYVRKACEASLRRLKRDTIDLYYAHRLDPGVPVEETVSAMSELLSAGKIRHIGLCEVSAEELLRAHQVHPITAVQSEYSLWHRKVERDILPVCRELQIALVAYSPLGRGFLTGKIRSLEVLEADDSRRADPRLQEQALNDNLGIVDHITDLARRKNVTPAQIAIAWLLHQDEAVIPIPGTRNSDRLLENCNALTLALSPDELEALSQELPATAKAADE